MYYMNAIHKLRAEWGSWVCPSARFISETNQWISMTCCQRSTPKVIRQIYFSSMKPWTNWILFH